MTQIIALAAALALPAVTSAAAMMEQVRSTGGTEIVGGTSASLADFPYIVSLTISGNLLCGGVLLNANTVLTAAHCSDIDPTTAKVRAGSTKWASGGTQVGVSAVAVHPDYNASTIDNDIALWHLATPIPTSKQIGYVTLTTQGSDPVANSTTTTAGWGTTSEGGKISASLRKVSVPVLDRASCQTEYKDFQPVTDNMFCAGQTKGGKDSCQGDSGGPIIDAATKTLVGLVSWGNGCAEAGFAGVYSRLGNYVDYINSHKFTS